MARVEIELPETFPFATELPIRVSDLNYGNHLGNDRVLTLAQEARVQLLARHGWSELDVAGAGLIQVDAAVVYRAEGKYGMVLRIEAAVAEVKTRGCDFLFRLTDAGTGKEIARAKTGVVFYDYAGKKVVHTPAAFREAFGAGSAG